MKKSHSFNSKLLTLDVYHYLFTEWLVRNNLYCRFVKNHARALRHEGSTNQLVRVYIQDLLEFFPFSMDRAIVAAFPFDSTPEGFDFWIRASDEWSKFYCDFSCK